MDPILPVLRITPPTNEERREMTAAFKDALALVKAVTFENTTLRATRGECEWKSLPAEEDDRLDGWKSECGQVHVFIADGPKENHYTFCPYCGGVIK